jgi:hypothetical protein
MSMGRQRVSTTSNLELHTKEVVDESLDKALELFATKKVDSTLHLDLNRLASPLNGRSPQPLNQEEMSEPLWTQHDVMQTMSPISKNQD